MAHGGPVPLSCNVEQMLKRLPDLSFFFFVLTIAKAAGSNCHGNWNKASSISFLPLSLRRGQVDFFFFFRHMWPLLPPCALGPGARGLVPSSCPFLWERRMPWPLPAVSEQSWEVGRPVGPPRPAPHSPHIHLRLPYLVTAEVS